jgi:hypothetical protein
VKSIGPPSFDIILSWYLVAILLPAGWYVREIHGWNNKRVCKEQNNIKHAKTLNF